MLSSCANSSHLVDPVCSDAEQVAGDFRRSNSGDVYPFNIAEAEMILDKQFSKSSSCRCYRIDSPGLHLNYILFCIHRGHLCGGASDIDSYYHSSEYLRVELYRCRFNAANVIILIILFNTRLFLCFVASERFAGPSSSANHGASHDQP